MSESHNEVELFIDGRDKFPPSDEGEFFTSDRRIEFLNLDWSVELHKAVDSGDKNNTRAALLAQFFIAEYEHFEHEFWKIVDGYGFNIQYPNNNTVNCLATRLN